MKNTMKYLKNITSFIKSNDLDLKPFEIINNTDDLEFKPLRIINNTNGTVTCTDEEKCVDRNYFCDDEGIKYGNECFSNVVIPKEIFVEAFNRYISR